jgi:capsular exopolysaccharide synthesis family protein
VTMEKSKQFITEKETGGLQQILFRYLPYWPLFLAFLLISAVTLFTYLNFTTPQYDTTASILIKDEKKGQEDSKMEEVLNVFNTKKIVENELEVLTSNAIIQDVIKTLKLYAPIEQHSGWQSLKKTPAFFTSPIAIEARIPDSLRTVSNISFSYSEKDNTVKVDGKAYPLNEWANTSYGDLKFIKNTHRNPVLFPVDPDASYSFSLVEMNRITKNITDNLKASQASKQSSVISLRMRDPLPKRSEAFLTELVNAYNRNSIEKKNEMAAKTLQFIENRLKDVRQELDSVESSVQRYRARSGVVDISEQSKLYLQGIEETDKQSTAVNIQLSALDEAEKYITSKSPDDRIVPSTLNIEDPTLAQLLDKVYTAESQYEKLRKTTAENNPVILSLQEEISKTKPSILENIRNQRKSLVANKSQLGQINNKYSSLLSSIPQKERQLVDISRQQNIKNEIYSFLLQKREETAYSINAASPDCTLVDKPASSVRPVTPNKPILAAVAGLAPFLLGIIIISLREQLNRKVLYRADIEKLTAFPVIGELIFDKDHSSIFSPNRERSFLNEQFRQIRTALKYQGTPPGNCKRILVTSSVKGEGKSFVSSNLAFSLARTGKKVALLELDLYQPKLSEMLQVEKQNGICDYLGDDTIRPDDIIVPTTLHQNLFIVPAGHLVEEPSDLIINGKLEILLNFLDTRFDSIIIDTAPVKAMTDAFNIAPMVNLVLYIIRHDHTPKVNIDLLDQEMDAYNIKNVALVFNGVKKRGTGRYSYGYGNGYGYDQRNAYDNYRKSKKSRA